MYIPFLFITLSPPPCDISALARTAYRHTYPVTSGRHPCQTRAFVKSPLFQQVVSAHGSQTLHSVSGKAHQLATRCANPCTTTLLTRYEPAVRPATGDG